MSAIQYTKNALLLFLNVHTSTNFYFCDSELQAEQHFDEAEDHLLGGGCRGVCQGNPRMSLPLKILPQ